MSLIGYALRTAKQYYDDKTYNHALRVATFVAEDPMIPEDKQDVCIALAIMHDLLEDTKYELKELEKVDLEQGYRFTHIDKEHFIYCLRLITKSKDDEYITYIKSIRRYCVKYPEAYWVKLADMKDHLLQTNTLTDKLKEKYLKALPYLL